MFVHEVRRHNKNTLSGLSLDTIAQQVKEMIEGKERKAAATSTAKGKGSGSKNRPESRPVEKKGKVRVSICFVAILTVSFFFAQKPHPPVATAPPPVASSVNYDENSCIICYEVMREVDTSRLDCGHRFHSKVRGCQMQ